MRQGNAAESPLPPAITPELCAGIVAGLQIGIAVFRQESDEDGAGDLVLVTANAAAERISGYPLSKFIGRRRAEIGAPSDLNDIYMRVLRSGEPVVVGDLPMVRDRIWSGYVFPLPDRRVGLAFEDVTAARRMERAVRDSEHHYRSIFEIRRQIETQQHEAAEFGLRAAHGHETALLLDDACQTVRDVLGGDLVTVFRHEPDEKHFALAAQTDTDMYLPPIVPNDPTRILGFVHSQSRAVSFDDLEHETRFRAPGLVGLVRSGIAVPVRGNTIDFGVMSLGFHRRRTSAEHDVAFVQTIGNSLADAIERLEAEQALKDREARLQLIVSRLVDAKPYVENLIDSANVVIIENDAEGEVRLVNRAFEKLTGRSRHAVVGTTVFDLFTDGLSVWRSNAVTRRNIEAEGRPVALGEQETESSIVAADGSHRVLRLRSNDVWSDGMIVGTIFFGVDVTDSIAAEAAKERLQSQVLNAAEEWRHTFDSVVSPILIVDGAETIRRANRAAAELTARAFHELVGAGIDALPEEEPWTTAVALVHRMHAADQRATLGETRDAAGKTWNISATPLDAAGQTSRSVIVVLSDISGIVELQESLRMNERMSAMGQLMAGVAHEVRNPLFGISAALDAFGAEFGETAEFEEYVKRLRSDTDRLRRLMNDLLDYGRPSVLRCEVQPFVPLVEHAMAVCLPLSQEKKVELRLRAQESLPVAAFDHDRMLQVLTNVIQNAIAFTAKESTVSIDVRADGADLVCAVSDRGPGFRVEDIPHVFNPFFTRRSGGTGLGLAIVHRIIGDHGGSVAARNNGVGGQSAGAVVEMRFPRR